MGCLPTRRPFISGHWQDMSTIAYYTMAQREASKPPKTRTMEELVQDYELTRRETEILGLVFQDLNNEEILDRLHISRHTLLKHLQTCTASAGFPSRWDLLKLRP